MQNALLSPRATFYQQNGSTTNEDSYSCCRSCKFSLAQSNGRKPPKFAIANGFAIGRPPAILTNRKYVELALLSNNRDMSHIFAYFGGQHKMIRGFHSFFKSDVAHTTHALQQVGAITDSKQIACILSGPFTTRQKAKALEQMRVDIPNVQEAFQWLRDNNRVYAMLQEERHFPQPIVIDES